MINEALISNALPFIGKNLISEIAESATIKDIEVGTVLLKEGQYVKVIPIVLSGLIKVFTTYQDKDLLLYYIQPNESCIMSFSAGLKNEPSRILAVTEEDTKAILIPTDKINKWINEYPQLNTLFYQQYNLRYTELLDTINHLLFDKMDKRLFDYLVKKVKLTNQNPLTISHRQIATELGTAREVISRTIKKLESDNLVLQHKSSIEILKL